MKRLNRHDFLLLVLGLLGADKEPFESRTRLMKVLYLVQEELSDVVAGLVGTARPYAFEMYLFGPFSTEVLNDLDMLEAEGLLEVIPTHVEGDLGPYLRYDYKLTEQGARRFAALQSSISPELYNALKEYLEALRSLRLKELKRRAYDAYKKTWKLAAST